MRKRDGHFVNFCTLTPFPDPIFPASRRQEVVFERGLHKSHISPFSGNRSCCGRGGNCTGCEVVSFSLPIGRRSLRRVLIW